MAGDRRATEGYSIAHRAIEKVSRPTATRRCRSPARPGRPWRWWAVPDRARALREGGGLALSLEGKANKLGQMVRGQPAMAMQGLAVVPIFAGYDLRRQQGPHLQVRPHRRAVRGGATSTPPAPAAATPAPPSSSAGARASTGLRRSSWPSSRLYEAADEDSATGGPDVVRGIYPTVATITADGFERVAEEEVAERFRALDRDREGTCRSATR